MEVPRLLFCAIAAFFNGQIIVVVDKYRYLCAHI